MKQGRRIGISIASGLAATWMLLAASYADPVTAAASPSAASSSAGGPPAGQPPTPPPEAIAACKGKAEGDKVTFTGRGGEQLTGVCHLAGTVLAARPDGGPGQRPPPPR